MRVRAQDSNGDYMFGHGSANFLVDSAEAVKQRLLTRLALMEGEWFLDVTEGTPYGTQILGEGTKSFYDFAIQQRILDTEDVAAITQYESSFDPATRTLTVTADVATSFGLTTTVTATF